MQKKNKYKWGNQFKNQQMWNFYKLINHIFFIVPIEIVSIICITGTFTF